MKWRYLEFCSAQGDVRYAWGEVSLVSHIPISSKPYARLPYSLVTLFSAHLLNSDKSLLSYLLQIRNIHNIKYRCPSPDIGEDDFDSFAFPPADATAATVVHSTLLYDALRGTYWSKLVPPQYTLHQACISGPLGAIIQLIESGRSMHDRDSTDALPLHYAVARGRQDVVRTLLDAGVDVNAYGRRFGTALQTAVRRRHAEIVKMLLEDAADLEKLGVVEQTLLL